MNLLEREQQLRALASYADDVAAGEGRLVMIAGEAGGGKSSLVEAFEARTRELTWAWGSCDGGFTPRPLGPLLDLADDLGGPVRAALERGARREELFSALLHTLEDLGRAALVFEDVHWADEATLDLLRYLARRLRRTAALVVVTYRDEELAADHPLRICLGQLASDRSTRRLDLPPLTPQAVATLARGTSHDPAELHRLTGGNAYFLTEVLRSEPGVLPPSARDAVLARVAGLGHGSRRLLEAAAVLGLRIDTLVLGRVVETSDALLDELIASGLLLSDGSDLRFRHELARLAVAGGIPGHRLTDLHRRAYQALVELGGTDDALLAHHAEGACNAVAVMEHAPRAAEQAARLSAHREATEQLQRALRWVGDDRRARGLLLDRLGHELGILDQWDAAHDARCDALDIWRERGDRLQEGATLTALTRTHARALRGAESDAAATEAEGVLRPLGPTPQLARALVAVAGSHMLHSRLVESIRAADEALALGRRLELSDVVADALNTRACAVQQMRGEWQPDMEEAVAVAAAAGLAEQAGRAWTNLYGNLRATLRLDEAERVFARAWEYVEEHDVRTYGNCLLGERSELLTDLGRWEEALGVVARLSAVEHLSPHNRLHEHVVRAQIAVRRGDDDAECLVRQAVGSAVASGEPQWIAPARLAAAELAWIRGDGDSARAGVDGLASMLDDVYRLGAVDVWARRTGVRPSGQQVPEPYATQLAGDPVAAAHLWQAVGMPYEAALALLDGDDEEGWREALETLERLGAHGTAGAARRRLRSTGAAVPRSRRTSTLAHPAGLTAREQEVLEQLALGRTNGEIADALVISPKTVDHHVSSVLGKLGTANRRDAAIRAVEQGLVLAAGSRPARDGEPARAT